MKTRGSLIGRLTVFGVSGVTFFVTPWTSYDPINVSRLLTLTVFSLGLFLLAFSRENLVFFRDKSLVSLLLISFIFWASASSSVSSSGLVEVLFGVSGRQTGLLAYFAFVVFMAVGLVIRNGNFFLNLLNSLIIVGVFAGMYGVIQSFGGDPFDWINPYSPVFGVFGNPNFHSSYMGITGAAALARIFMVSDLLMRLLLVGYQALVIFNIFASKSQQGFFVYVIGILTVTMFLLRAKNLKIAQVSVGLSIVGGLFAVLDILQKSPWASFSYEESVSYRGDFWRAGWRMLIDNPIFGVGIDGYRDNFRLYRDQVAVSRNAEAMVDSAHNVYLDIASGGGFPLLLIYILLILLVLRSIYRFVKRNRNFDPIFAGMVGCWFAYQAQSIISINQIGLAIWGWVLSGAIIGYESNQFKKEEINVFKGNFEGLKFGIGALVGLAISLPLFIADSGFRSSIASGDVTKIVESVKAWPQSPVRMTLAASILRTGGFPDQAVEISKQATEIFPMNFEAWQELSLNEKISSEEKQAVLKKMKELDPLNPGIPTS